MPTDRRPSRRVTTAKIALFAEALAALIAARLALAVLVVPRAARWYGLAAAPLRHGDAPIDYIAELAPVDPVATGNIAWAIASAAGRLPWNSTCLARAFAGTRMLHRRALPAEVVLGVARVGEGKTRALSAHAWLSSGPSLLTGGGEHELFAPVGAFRSLNRR